MLLDGLRRAGNGVRKMAAGLRPFGESVWPGVRNDLFVAHESIYVFAERFAPGRRVLDAGCGAGYGTFRLARNGAAAATGIDLDRLNIRYARRHFPAPNLSFLRGDLEDLRFPDASFDFLVASNSLEHLREPRRFLGSMRGLLSKEGRALIAVPPILGEPDVAVHRAIPYHRSNLSVDDWLALFGQAGFRVACFSHRAASDAVKPDFRSPSASRLSPADFCFLETTRDGLYAEPSITAIFLLSR